MRSTTSTPQRSELPRHLGGAPMLLAALLLAGPGRAPAQSGFDAAGGPSGMPYAELGVRFALAPRGGGP